MPEVRVGGIPHTPMNAFCAANSGYFRAEVGDDVAFSYFNPVDFVKLVVREAFHMFEVP